MEDYVYILDLLPQGRPDAPPSRREPICFGVGEDKFTLLELIPKPGVSLTVGEKVYVGKDADRRDKIQKIRGRVQYSELTSAAHGELPYVIEDVIHEQGERFLRFYNQAAPINLRFHSLELLPGLGKKTVETIVGERRKGEFKTFEDLTERTGFHHPERHLAERILEELQDQHQKYFIFTRPPREAWP